jgi:hypothetical protein
VTQRKENFSMTQEQLDAILKELGAKPDKEGFVAMPEGSHLTLQIAHAGASLSVTRIEALRVESGLVYARTPRREIHAFARDDVFAVASDGGGGQATRRPGFG